MLKEFNIEKIAHYLERHKADLPKLYNWGANTDSLDEIVQFSDQERNDVDHCSTNYDRAVLLKNIINQRLGKYKTSNQDLFNALSHWIIRDWGGIATGNKDLTKNLINSFFDGSFSPDFERIASKSKVASFLDPENYIIYDSRVAYSLNWIILSENAGNKYFPVPEGRNSKMVAFDVSVLIRLKHIEKYKLTSDEDLKRKRFINNRDKDVFIDRKLAYNLLNQLIKEINARLWKEDPEKSKKLFYTEMLLFSIADSEVYRDITKWYSSRD